MTKTIKQIKIGLKKDPLTTVHNELRDKKLKGNIQENANIF